MQTALPGEDASLFARRPSLVAKVEPSEATPSGKAPTEQADSPPSLLHLQQLSRRHRLNRHGLRGAASCAWMLEGNKVKAETFLRCIFP